MLKQLPIISFALLAGMNFSLANEFCREASVKGSYIFFVQGMSAQNLPLAYAGMLVFDGKGKVEGVAKFSNDSEKAVQGSYKIEKSCRIAVDFPGFEKVTYFTGPTGDELVYVVTTGRTIASSAKRVSRNNLLALKP